MLVSAPPFLRTMFALLVATFAMAAIANAQDTPPAAASPSLTYDQAWMQTAAVETQNTNGYASIGYSPAIFSIPNQPFTAQRTYKEWARDSTSTTPVVTTTVTIARDSAGRVHYESSRSPGDIVVRISDPVLHVNTQYEVSSDPTAPTTAQQCTQPMMSQISGPLPDDVSSTPTANTVAPAATPLPTPSKTELGSRMMEGTLAYGQTRTDYLDLQPGVLTMIKTAWFSPSLGLTMIQSSDYSNQNKFTEDTHNLKLGDPDANLFALPAGYTLTGSTASCVPLLNP